MFGTYLSNREQVNSALLFIPSLSFSTKKPNAHSEQALSACCLTSLRLYFLFFCHYVCICSFLWSEWRPITLFYSLPTSLKGKRFFWSHIQRTVKFVLCIQPIPEEQWAPTAQHSRFLANTSVKGADWRYTYIHCLDGGGNRSTWRKPTWARGEHADSWESNPGPSCYEATVLTTKPVLPRSKHNCEKVKLFL